MTEVVETKQWQRLIGSNQSWWGRITKSNPLCYSFFFLCHNQEHFSLSEEKVSKGELGQFLETMAFLSQETSESVLSYDHCHSIGEKKIAEFNLEKLASCNSKKELFSFGRKANRVRLIGFFDDKRSYVFHVCLIDWKHKLYQPKKQFVFP